MSNILTIASRQFRSYFNGPIAYVVIAIMLLALGVFFWSTFFLAEVCSARQMFQVLNMIMVFTLPALTMGLIAEEKRTGTIELLITMPVSDAQVILGKYLGVLGLYAVFLALTITYPIAISTLGDLDWGPVFGGYFASLFQGAAILALGLMASSWTKNQVVALFVGLALAFSFWVLGKLLPLLPAASVLEWLSFDYHFDNMARGVITARNVLYFVTVAVVALSIAFRSLESRRWK